MTDWSRAAAWWPRTAEVDLRADLTAEHLLRLAAPLLRRALARTDRTQPQLLAELADTAPRT